METINTILTNLTDADTLLAKVNAALAAIDPNFPEEEEKYRHAVELMERDVPGAGEYLAARKQEFVSGLIYVGWLGFQWNLDCFYDPIHKLLLNEDFEELQRENRMHTLPMAQAAQRKIDAFLQTLPQDQHPLTDPITDYYAYLRTYAYKLAHYAGFSLANAFLPHVIPGYTTDPVLTLKYTHILDTIFGMNVDSIVGERTNIRRDTAERVVLM